MANGTHSLATPISTNDSAAIMVIPISECIGGQLSTRDEFASSFHQSAACAVWRLDPQSHTSHRNPFRPRRHVARRVTPSTGSHLCLLEFIARTTNSQHRLAAHANVVRS